MDQQYNASRKKTQKSSKLPVVIVLLVTVLLVLLLMKAFRHKQTDYAQTAISLPSSSLQKESVAPIVEKHEPRWENVTTQPRDSLASVFDRIGLSRQTLQAVLLKNPHAKVLTKIKPNQTLQFLIQDHELERLLFPLSVTQYLIIRRNGTRFQSQIHTRKMDSHNQYVTATVRDSLYATARRLDIPYKLIQKMTEIFNWEIDFARDVRSGDQFTITYQAFFVENTLVTTGDIIAVTYKTRDKLHQAIRHRNSNGEYEYFNAQGMSLRKAFSRYPLLFSHISSTFNLSRLHPILHYKRPHKGVDLAAPIGTPIRATGDGRIASIGREKGYGNMIKIAHNKTYSTVYAHMLKFQKGLARGHFIKRGQVIGYVGQTGLATGPHCHFEFRVNQQPKNPTTIDLPRASPVQARELARFKAQAQTLMARMHLFEEAHFAALKAKKPTMTS